MTSRMTMLRDALCLTVLLNAAALSSCSSTAASPAPGPSDRAPATAAPPSLPTVVLERGRKALVEAGFTGDMRLISGEPTTWADSSLGCRMPGREYAQVVTNGHVLRFTAGGRMHEVHVAGDTAVVCSPALGTGAPQRATRRAFLVSELKSVIDKARADLAARLDTSVEDVHLQDFTAVTWPDENLGCSDSNPVAGEGGAKAAVPGFRLVLMAAGRSYPYHTDSRRAIPCPPVEPR